MRKMFTHISCTNLLIILLYTFCCCNAYADYTESPDIIQQRAGLDLTIHCDLKGLVDDEKLENAKIHWFFKQCGDSSDNLNSCQEEFGDDWTELPCGSNFCKPDLILRNITEKYSGLYKCTIYPHEGNSRIAHGLDIKLVRTYQLDVRNTTMAVPEFLDYPSNKSAIIGTQVVFQCRVHSEVHPTIKWFRRIPEARNVGLDNFAFSDNFSSHIIRYNGHYYELLTTAHEKFISDQTYLSKLIINNVNWQDDNTAYACVAVNYRGHRIRLFYLSVHEPEYWADYDEEYVKTDPQEFWLLFLMPLGLAMLPVSVWLAYIIYKKCKSKDELKRRRLEYTNKQTSPELKHILIK